MSDRLRRRRDERGAFLVLWSVMLTGMLVMMAVVLDLGHVRAERRQTQSVTDLSLLAGGGSFSTPVGLDPMSACQDTIKYLNQNLSDLPASIDPVNFCNQSGKELNKTICNPPFTQPQATPSKVIGVYEIEIRYPVTDAEIADASTGVRSSDGEPCERMKLSVKRTDSSFFAGIVGVNKLETRATATIRRMPVNASLFPALWLLDPTGCVSLEVNGAGTTVNIGTATVPGVVTIDSDGTTCNSNQYTLSSSGRLRAFPLTGPGAYDRGIISLHALPSGKLTCVAPACNPAEVPSNVSPQPIRRDKRATRAPVDWRYDCKSKYQPYQVAGSTYKVPLTGCPNAGSVPAHVTNLRDGMGTVNANQGNIVGYVNYTGPCSIVSPAVLGVDGAGVKQNLRIPCPTFEVKSAVTFPGQNVVFDGDVKITDGGSIRFNYSNDAASLPPECLGLVCVGKSSREAALFYMRNGTLSVTGGGSLDLNRTAVFGAGGHMTFTGGGSPRWTSPGEGPFKGLAYWNETASNQFQVSGGASMSLHGIFFTPHANPFEISGGSPTVQQQAQFVSRKAKISGGGTLNLTPLQSEAISLPPPAAVLIR